MTDIEWGGPTDPRGRVATLTGGHAEEAERLFDATPPLLEHIPRVTTTGKPLPSFAQERLDRAELTNAMLSFARTYSALELDVLHEATQKDLQNVDSLAVIAAAPELLAACKGIAEWLADTWPCAPGCDCACDAVRAAIAKATGEPATVTP